ncbi:putative disease resistance protein [Vitis vinifera]|uniref:Putative disease resistance protein n=1 Tax=Vitis vinifera TaxID=29760 RepID=A0A438CNK9_VITVI|nr:putative disease resistance protein [Vitis vinifera]
MGAKGIEVKCLAWEEAFALFQAYVGEDTIYSHPHIPKLAEIASKECDGLPLALITIGRAMAGTKTPEEWEKKIQMLKNYPTKFPGMENHLFPRLAFSYDSLQDETIKSCFLYCSLFPEDSSINCDALIQLWIGEGFLDEYSDIKEARNGGEDIIASLNHACLLEITVTDNIWTQARCRCVKMHDVIRDMALWLACQNGNKKQNKFVNAQEVEKWKGTPRLSFVSASFEEHMEPPSFPNLQTLLDNNITNGAQEFEKTELFSIMNSDEATHEDCRALLVELEGLKCMGEVSISLDSVLAIQTLLNSHKLQRSLRSGIVQIWKMLRSIWKRKSIQHSQGINNYTILLVCPNLRKLPFDSNIGISKNLEEIDGEGEWWVELEWENQTIMHNLAPYFKPL